MITGELRSRIDKLWEEFWTGGITNPLTVIEQISFLMFARMLDLTETRNERKARRTGKPFRATFAEEKQHLRWQNFRQLGQEEMLKRLRDEVFPHFKTIGQLETDEGTEQTTFNEYFKDAQLMIQKPSLLVKAVEMIDALPLDEGDVKGDLYEYLLSKLTTAGINGQFRTPRHIIRLMVELVDPLPPERVCDPACGTGGFLVGVMEYLLRRYSSAEGTLEREIDGEEQPVYTGDMLDEDQWQWARAGMLTGFDFDATMLRIAAMNLLLHGVEAPQIHYQDTLSSNFTEHFPGEDGGEGAFDVILANPPFKGSLDYEDTHKSLLATVKTKKTELLFVALILRMLRTGGRCAMVVPDGVLFGSSNAHQALRQTLVEKHQLEGVISLPSGVFRPYAGVSTAILVFTKDGSTQDVFFFDVQADGFSLDDKREKVEASDLPGMLDRWNQRGKEDQSDRTAKAFVVSKAEISANKYDLSLNRYKDPTYEEVGYEPPAKIVARLQVLEAQIQTDLVDLRALLCPEP